MVASLTFSLRHNHPPHSTKSYKSKQNQLPTSDPQHRCSLLKRSQSAVGLGKGCNNNKDSNSSDELASSSTSLSALSNSFDKQTQSFKHVTTLPASVSSRIYDKSHKNKYLIAANNAAFTSSFLSSVIHSDNNDNRHDSSLDLNPSLSINTDMYNSTIDEKQSIKQTRDSHKISSNSRERVGSHHSTHSLATSRFLFPTNTHDTHSDILPSHTNISHGTHGQQTLSSSDHSTNSIVSNPMTQSFDDVWSRDSSSIASDTLSSLETFENTASTSNTILTPMTSISSLSVHSPKKSLSARTSLANVSTTSSLNPTLISTPVSSVQSKSNLEFEKHVSNNDLHESERDQFFFTHPFFWRLFLSFGILLRLYFSSSPSYIHPDEHFQGPESIADSFFGWATKKSWEFSSAAPARSYFVSWIVYGIPMFFVNLIHRGSRGTLPDPASVLSGLRLAFALGNWVLSDMAIDRLTLTHNHKTAALFFTATSYVTWTYQSHTFSNSIETSVLLWCLVIIYEFKTQQKRTCNFFSRTWDSFLLGTLVAFGIFNRITFPAFLIVPALRLMPFFLKYPFSFVTCTSAFILTSITAVYFDTICFSAYSDAFSENIPSLQSSSFSAVASAAVSNFPQSFELFLQKCPALSIVLNPFSLSSSLLESGLIITPLNNLLYNLHSDNLALHGIHARTQHLFANLPQLLGPAVILLFSKKYIKTIPFQAAFSGIFFLSLVQHQEPRFLVPSIPLLACCLDFYNLQFISDIFVKGLNWKIFDQTKLSPTKDTTLSTKDKAVELRKKEALKKGKRLFFFIWMIFNIAMGTLMGIFHQGGVLPVQIFLSKLTDPNLPSSPSFNGVFLPPTSPVNPLVTDDTSAATVTDNSTSTNPITDYVFIWWKTYSPPIWMLGKPDGSVKTIDPVETVPGGGENWMRYTTVFNCLDQMESDCGIKQSKKSNTSVLSTFKTPGSNSVSAFSPNILVVDAMGAKPPLLATILRRFSNIQTHFVFDSRKQKVYLIAPTSAILLNEELPYTYSENQSWNGTESSRSHSDSNALDTKSGHENRPLTQGVGKLFANSDYSLKQVWIKKQHLSLDDIDIADLRSLAIGLGVYEVVSERE